MKDSDDIRRGRHCVFQMHVHLVFVTKYRREVFTKEVLSDLQGIFSGVCNDFEAEWVEFDGEHDHLHLPVNKEGALHQLERLAAVRFDSTAGTSASRTNSAYAGQSPGSAADASWASCNSPR